ncbi:hypothetical protein BU15DRAFT_74565 [Melanogaster broomeanus]|nr:hypothetical protein BU15DRAFT_74565 [Melanogaster broomeanus]
MNTALSVALQAFYTIYTAVLVYLTQNLALTRDLSRPQLLTAIHDTSGAWNGIGAALLFLWRQTKVTVSLGKVLAVATYLLNTMILHITSSSILQFQTYNTTTIEMASSTLTWLNSMDYELDWDTISDVVSYVPQLAEISMVGLANDTLYEVIDPNRGVGNVNVSAVTVQADCGLVSNANISFLSQASIGWTVFGQDGSFNSTGQWMILSVPPSVDQVLTLANPMHSTNTILFLASTRLDIDDSLIPQVAIPITVQYGAMSNIMYAYVIACGASLISRGAVVDAQTGELKELGPLLPTGDVSKSWEILDWNTQNNFGFNDSYYNGTSYPFTSGLSEFPCQCSWTEYTHFISDVTLMMSLGLDSEQVYGNCYYSNPTFQLDVEYMQNAVAKQIASSYFTAGLFGFDIGFQRPPSHVNVTVPIQEVRLNINILPLSFATAASIIVLVLAVHMTHMDKRAHPLVSNTGVLDILWLSSQLPELTERLATVEKPSTDSLRAAGKFNVCLAEPTLLMQYQDGELKNAMKLHDGRENERGYLVSSLRSETETLLLDDLPENGLDDLKRHFELERERLQSETVQLERQFEVALEEFAAVQRQLAPPGTATSQETVEEL